MLYGAPVAQLVAIDHPLGGESQPVDPLDDRRSALRRGADQRHRQAEAGLAADGGDPLPALDGVARRAEAVAEPGGRGVEVGDDEHEPQKAAGAPGAGSAARFERHPVHDLEDHLAQAEEALVEGASLASGTSRTRRRSIPAAASAAVVRSRSVVTTTT